MTPKEKAEELFFKFYETVTFFDETKQCALIAVDEILAIKKEIWDNFDEDYFNFWKQVRQEIENFE